MKPTICVQPRLDQEKTEGMTEKEAEADGEMHCSAA